MLYQDTLLSGEGLLKYSTSAWWHHPRCRDKELVTLYSSVKGVDKGEGGGGGWSPPQFLRLHIVFWGENNQIFAYNYVNYRGANNIKKFCTYGWSLLSRSHYIHIGCLLVTATSSLNYTNDCAFTPKTVVLFVCCLFCCLVCFTQTHFVKIENSLVDVLFWLF